jgi:HD-GYP domain-containing protein (c-di-GMP phosphodiesterase class II)/Tfp pilus assembly protein PilZ
MNFLKAITIHLTETGPENCMAPIPLKGKPLYNSRIIDAYIKLVKCRYSQVNIGELLDYAGIKAYEVADQGHWFSQEEIERFHDKLVQLSGNPQIAREAGRYAASPDALGVMRQYALGLIDPANAFALINRASINFTRSSLYESRKISPNKVEIVVLPLGDESEKPFQCENRMGFFEAIVLMFNDKLPHIEHFECIFSGGKACRYIISWEKSTSVIMADVRKWATVSFLALNLALVYAGTWRVLGVIAPLSAVTLFLFTVMVEKSEKKELLKSLSSTRDSTEKLLDQINHNYNNALVTNEVGRALSASTSNDEIMANVIQILEKRLDYDRGLILLANPEKTKLILQAGFGYSDEHFDKLSFHLDRPESKGIFVTSYRDKKPFLINDLDSIEETLSLRSLALAKKLGTHSFICCPIIREDSSIGILAVDNIKSKRPLVQSDMSLLMGIASVIAVSIQNAELFESRLRQFNSIIQVLAATIDARDSLTAGHSEKVTEYALGICKELGLSSDYRNMIRVASLLHDYGKIAVPDSILKKAGKLTDDEYEIVKTHTDKTREILSRIHFEGIYCQVPEIAAAHHEKNDGSGYPMGLRSRDIPLGAKIIAVADYFEAITAKRHYRDPMEIMAAFESLRNEIGRHFDRRLVEALVSYYTRTYIEKMPAKTWVATERGRIRVPCRAPVYFRVNGRTASATSEDISASGIYVATNIEVQEGVPVELSIALPDSLSAIVEASGRVAWVNSWRTRQKPDLPTGFGVELLDFKEAAREMFMAFMSTHVPASYH